MNLSSRTDSIRDLRRNFRYAIRLPPPPYGTSGKPNWENQTVWTGDNLNIMRGMNSGSVDLIYLDPPFNSKANYAAPIGSKAAGAAFKDTWGLDDVNLAWHGEIKHDYPGLYDLLSATRRIHGDSMMSYLIYMAIRIMEMRRLLKSTGSIYLHCDPTASHYLKLLMDAVFGKEGFRNEIVWRIGWVSGFKTQKRGWIRNHDTILYYVASPVAAQRFNKEYIPYAPDYVRRDGKRPTGKGIPLEDTWNCSDADRLDSLGIKSFAKKTGYPTEKPLNLVRRIIRASSNDGEIVLDPFCGCATACIAAEFEHRQWVGIDISSKAADLVRSRMEDELDLFWLGENRTDIPNRTDLGKVIRYNDPKNRKYLYGEQGGYCNGCAHHFQMQNLTVDHIIARARGGTDHISNLQLLCSACNSLKGVKSHQELLVRLTDKGWAKKKRVA